MRSLTNLTTHAAVTLQEDLAHKGKQKKLEIPK